MRAVVVGVLAAALALGGCGTDDDGAPEEPSSAAPTSTAVGPDPESVALATAAAEAFYDAAGRRDCITMRTLSTPDEQREDDAWADCIDVMLEVAGDDFDHSLGDPEVAGDRVTYTVSSGSLVDGERVERQDPLVLVPVGETWLVDDSVVTAAS